MPFTYNYVSPNFMTFLDDIGGAKATYSLRKLHRQALNCIRVRRSSDNAESDIGFSSGILDTATLLTFAGVGSAYVTIWYDQSGNGNHASQTSALVQPTIVSSGTLQVDDVSKPTVVFDGGDRLSLANLTLFKNLENCFINAVAKDTNRTGGDAAHTIFVGTTNAGTGGRVLLSTRTAGANNFGAGGRRLDADSFAASTKANDANKNILSGKFDFSSAGQATLYVNGTAQTAASYSSGAGNSQDALSGSVAIGSYASSNYFIGNISEIIFFQKLLSTTERNNLESNQGTFYSITVTT